MKTCSRCYLDKDESEYYSQQGAKCKQCCISVAKAYKARNKEKILQYERDYHRVRRAKDKLTKGAFTNLWQEVNKDPVLFTLKAKQLLKQINALEPKKKIDLWS